MNEKTLREAAQLALEQLERQQMWHEAEKKAISKSGNRSPGVLWRDCQHREELNELDVSIPIVRDALALPDESAILERARYHAWPADPETDTPADYELFPADVECETCIDVLIVRADAWPATVERKPLTDERIEDMRGEANRGFNIEREDYFKAARDAEAAHGIKGTP